MTRRSLCFGLHTLGNHRLIGDQQQGAARDAVGEAGGEDRRGLHVDRHRPGLAEIVLELFVVLPHPPIGRVNRARPVVEIEVADGGRDRALELECGERRHFRQQVIIRGALAANGGDRQDQVAELIFLLESAALAEEEHRLGLDGAEQIHDRRGIGAAHAEVDHGDPIGGDVGHGPIPALDLATHLLAGRSRGSC